MNKQLLAQLFLLFILTQALGLFAGNYLLEQGIRTTIVSDNPEGMENALGLIIWILFITAVLLIVIKFAPEKLAALIFKAMELLAIFGSGIIVTMPLNMGDLASILICLALVSSRIIWKENVLLRNITSIIAAAGAGALIGASIGTTPLLVFVLLIAAYDFIAVFRTGHMVTLAKSLTKKNLSFTYAMPTSLHSTEIEKNDIAKGQSQADRRSPSLLPREGGKGHQYELGTGDMVVPLAFAVSVLGEATKIKFIPMPFALLPSLAILAVSLAGISFTLHYVSLEKGRVLPALPVQAMLMAIVFCAIKFAGF
ncbi:Signal-peptide peptidase, presenilin aspartyl protease [uncultured archaeon]|nr:Signal-peptide peptidase, presenilin aspartyl protease [uncultured archaeon]